MRLSRSPSLSSYYTTKPSMLTRLVESDICKVRELLREVLKASVQGGACTGQNCRVLRAPTAFITREARLKAAKISGTDSSYIGASISSPCHPLALFRFLKNITSSGCKLPPSHRKCY